MKRNLKMKILAVAISAILLADSAFSAAVLRNSRFLTTNEQKFVRKSALRENQATEAKYSDEVSSSFFIIKSVFVCWSICLSPFCPGNGSCQ